MFGWESFHRRCNWFLVRRRRGIGSLDREICRSRFLRLSLGGGDGEGEGGGGEGLLVTLVKMHVVRKRKSILFVSFWVKCRV